MTSTSNFNTFHISITHTITCPAGNSDFYSIIISIILYQLDIHGIVINGGLMDYSKIFSAHRGPYDFAFLYSPKMGVCMLLLQSRPEDQTRAVAKRLHVSFSYDWLLKTLRHVQLFYYRIIALISHRSISIIS